jgi:hypothetical protein
VALTHLRRDEILRRRQERCIVRRRYRRGDQARRRRDKLRQSTNGASRSRL